MILGYLNGVLYYTLELGEALHTTVEHGAAHYVRARRESLCSSQSPMVPGHRRVVEYILAKDVC